MGGEVGLVVGAAAVLAPVLVAGAPADCCIRTGDSCAGGTFCPVAALRLIISTSEIWLVSGGTFAGEAWLGLKADCPAAGLCFIISIGEIWFGSLTIFWGELKLRLIAEAPLVCLCAL